MKRILKYDYYESLTHDGIYEVIQCETRDGCYCIMSNDFGRKATYQKSSFMSDQEHRNMVLNDLLDND